LNQEFAGQLEKHVSIQWTHKSAKHEECHLEGKLIDNDADVGMNKIAFKANKTSYSVVNDEGKTLFAALFTSSGDFDFITEGKSFQLSSRELKRQPLSRNVCTDASSG